MPRFLRETKWLRFLGQVTRPQGLLLWLLLFVSGTFPRSPNLSHLWQSGSYFPFPRWTFSCCLFSINLQMLLLNHFISSTFYPFLNFCIGLFPATLLLSPTPTRPIPESCYISSKSSWPFLAPAECPQLWREKVWLTTGGPFQDELSADSQMLLSSGRLLFKIPVGTKNACWGSGTNPQFVLECF